MHFKLGLVAQFKKGVFVADSFCFGFQQKNQTQTISGVETKHPTQKVARVIQIISSWVRSMMTHITLHWSDGDADTIVGGGLLFLFRPSGCIITCQPISGVDIFAYTKTQSDHRDLLRTRVRGCYVFVLHNIPG